MTDQLLFSELINDIYEAAYQPSLWPRVTEKIARITDSRSGAILIRDNMIEEASGFYPAGLPSEAVEDYARFGHLDPAFPIMQKVPVGAAINAHGSERHELESPKYYENIRKKYDIGYVCGANIIVDDVQHVGLGLQRSATDTEYSQKTLELVTAIIPHLQRGMKIHREFIRLRVETTAMGAGLDNLMVGLVLFDQLGTPVYINSMAESILNEHPAIDLINGRIVPERNEDARQLHHLIHSCLDPASTEQERGGVLGLRHDQRKYPLALMVQPVATSQLANVIDGELAYAALYISDPERPLPIDAETIASLYQLSRCESNIAIMLANGMGVEAIAESQNRSVHTVRSHLKSVFQKTGTASQAALVRLLLSGATLMSGTNG